MRMQPGQQRYPEIDLLRCAAILLMIAYHTAFDLAVLYGWNIAVFSGPWKVVGTLSATTFLLLVGCSGVLLRQRCLVRGESEWSIAIRFWKRGTVVLCCAAAISAVTAVYVPQAWVRFGILHLIGVTLLLQPGIARLGVRNAAIAIVALFASSRMPAAMQEGWWIGLPFGIVDTAFVSIDYYPLLPWISVVLAGSVLGSLAYTDGSPLRNQHRLRMRVDALGAWPGMRLLQCIGRRSLWVYMIHQPLLLLLLRLALGPPHACCDW